jgi:hypothetical protein
VRNITGLHGRRRRPFHRRSCVAEPAVLILDRGLTELTQVSFALAGSGAQGGKDGASLPDDGAVQFEGKLYDGPMPKNEVLAKIAEMSAEDQGEIDLWILGATVPVLTQLATIVRKSGGTRALVR